MTINITTKTDRTPQSSTGLEQALDSTWLKSTFNIPDNSIVKGDEYSIYIRKNRYFSTSDFKFASTKPGMSMAVNPKPQFTRYCDIRSSGKIKSRNTDQMSVKTLTHKMGLGMGHYYSEAIDDNQQRIFLRFGVPKYMSMLTWMAKSFDVNKAVTQNRGIITSTTLEVIGLVSKVFAFAAAPLLGVGMFLAGVIVQNSRFYSVKDTMYLYWASVEALLNQIVARRTMLPMILRDYSFRLDNQVNTAQAVDSEFIKTISEYLPDIINPETGRISVFSLALRSQAAFNRMLKEDYDKSGKNENPSTDFTGYQYSNGEGHDTYFTNNRGEPTNFVKYIFDTAYTTLVKGTPKEEVNMLSDSDQTSTLSNLIEKQEEDTDENGNPIDLSLDPADPSDNVDKKLMANAKKKQSTFDRYKEYAMAELSEGAAFAIFNVDATGSVGESFTNSVTGNPIEASFNAISAKARNIGNLLSSATDIPIVGDVMKFAGDAGATILSNSTFGIANPLLALAYGVNVSMPKVWESSSASLPRASYKMKLISPYGNAYSQLFNIYLPLAMILAGSLPRSTGSSSYTSPFVCQLFDRGRVNIQLGMIDSVNITRGTSNLAFTRSGKVNAIDVDISIANMDEIIAIDTPESGVISKLDSVFNLDFSDTPMTSYLNTITGMDVYTQIYRIPSIRLKLAERYMTLKSVINPDPAAMAAFTVDKIPFNGIIKNLIGNTHGAYQQKMNSGG